MHRDSDSDVEACRSQGEPDYWKAVAVCSNVDDDEEREDCFADIAEERREAGRLCHVQMQARHALCDVLGEDRYDPDFEPGQFDNDFNRLTRPNRYYPLAVGSRWDFVAPNEAITVEILNKTKLVEGVTCIVVNDKVSVGGRIVEDTNDWIAQARDGDVYYCGEEVQDRETFAGDAPEEPESSASTARSRQAGTATSPASCFAALRSAVSCIVRSSRSATPKTWPKCSRRPTPSAAIPSWIVSCRKRSRICSAPVTA